MNEQEIMRRNVVACYVFANTIKRNDFYKVLTTGPSIFGRGMVAEARGKLLSNFVYQAMQSLNYHADEKVPFKGLLKGCALLIQAKLDEIVELYKLNIPLKERKPEVENQLSNLAGIGNEQVLQSIASMLTQISGTNYRTCTFDVSRIIVELTRTCGALNTLVRGSGNDNLDALIKESVETVGYFKNGYPKDMLYYDVISVKNREVKKLWYNTEYCSTFLQYTDAGDPRLGSSMASINI
jgi:hypothetical protein